MLFSQGLTSGFCSGYGFDLTTREGTFTIGVKNIHESQIPTIETEIMKKLAEIVKNGLDPSLIEMAVNQIEMNARIPKKDFGLTFLNNILGVYATTDDFLNGSGMEFLKSGENMRKIMENIKKKKRFFEGLIQKYLIENTHRVRVVMNPDKNLVREQYEEERKLLRKIEGEKTREEKEKILIEV